MAGEGMSVEVRGLREAQRKMEQVVRDLSGPPMVNAMRDATLIVQRTARMYSPVDKGRLKASIIPQVIAGAEVGGVRGIVGSNVEYAPYVELRPARHTVGRMHYLRDAVLDNKDRITAKIDATVQMIVRTVA